MSNRERIIRILEKAAVLRKKAPLSWDTCDMIWCALSEETDDDLGNAEWQLGLPVLTKTDGHLDERTNYLHQSLNDLHE